jgi:hypothetical protein
MGSRRSAEGQSGLCRIQNSRMRRPRPIGAVARGRRTGGCSECHERRFVLPATLHRRKIQGFRDAVEGAELERRPARRRPRSRRDLSGRDIPENVDDIPLVIHDEDPRHHTLRMHVPPLASSGWSLVRIPPALERPSLPTTQYSIRKRRDQHDGRHQAGRSLAKAPSPVNGKCRRISSGQSLAYGGHGLSLQQTVEVDTEAVGRSR